jgi:hypothetical protein
MNVSRDCCIDSNMCLSGRYLALELGKCCPHLCGDNSVINQGAERGGRLRNSFRIQDYSFVVIKCNTLATLTTLPGVSHSHEWESVSNEIFLNFWVISILSKFPPSLKCPGFAHFSILFSIFSFLFCILIYSEKISD